MPGSRVFIAFVFAGTAGLVAAHAQQPVERQTFRSGREVLTISTAVRDASGKPVTDLQPTDFTVHIDGQPRKVVTSRLYGHEEASAPPAATPVAAPVSNLGRPPGRAVVIAVDRDSIRSGGERAMLETAAKMVESLGPSDAAAAASLPGQITDLTRDHAAVAASVRAMTGTQPPPQGSHYLTWAEALGYDHHDSSVIQAVVSRECTETQYCPNELILQAREMVLTGRFHAQNVIQQLSSIIARFGSINAPKHLILISSGLPFDQELIDRYKDLADKAARAHVSLFVVQLDQASFDSSTRGRGEEAQTYGGREVAEGLGTIASMTGGRYFSGVGPAGGVFDRVAADIRSFYELGVESVPADADGKTHKIEITIARPGVSVTAPAATVVARPATIAPVDMLKHALAEPTDVTGLALEVTTYVTHSSDPGKVRVLVAAAAPDPAQGAPAVWGSVVMDGNKVLGAVGTAVAESAPTPWSSSGTLDVAPGRYRLRTAIVSGDRVGTLEVPLAAGLRAVGDARASDLIVGVVANGRLEAKTRFSRTEHPRALIELSSEHPLNDLGGLVILSPVGADTPQVQRQSLVFRPRSDDKAIVLGEAVLDLSSVPPGRYTASVSVEFGGKPAGRISRVIEIGQ